MNVKLFFLILSASMAVLTLVTICTGPIINGNIIGFSPSENCQDYMDYYNKYKDEWKNPTESQKRILNYNKQEANLCKRRKAMFGLEKASLIADIFLAILCCILGLLHYFDIGKYFEKITGIIGLATGVIGLVLTIVYVGYSAYIFNNDYSDEGLLYDNGAFLKLKDGKYVASYEDEDYNENQYYDKAKYKDLGKKQYNYNSEVYKKNQEGDYSSCKTDSISHNDLKSGSIFALSNCEYVWKTNFPKYDNYVNKYRYDRWLTTIILSVFISLCAIGVAVFGLLLFLDSGSGHTPMS